MTDPTSGTVDIPKVGRVKKIYVYGGVAVVTVAAILWYRKNHGTASTAGQATDPAGNVGQIDPATGFVFGSPQDVDALASMSGPGSGSSSGGGGGGGGDGSGGGGGVTDQVAAGPPFHDNAAWYQYVASYLIGTVGLDPGQVSVDLGKYLAGNQVTVAERDAVIEPAIGAGGTPPVSGTNGFPPSINLAGSPTGPGNGTPGAVHLSIGSTTDTSGVVKWSTVSGASGYAWKASGPNGFSRSGTVTTTSVSLSGLTPGSAYKVTVHATNSAGSGPDATITLNTRSSGPTTPPSGSYAAVEVVPYVSHNPPWNSYIQGIATHYGYSDWHVVWDDPKNAPLREKRGAPNLIRAGDTVYVKRK